MHAYGRALRRVFRHMYKHSNERCDHVLVGHVCGRDMCGRDMCGRDMCVCRHVHMPTRRHVCAPVYGRVCIDICVCRRVCRHVYRPVYEEVRMEIHTDIRIDMCTGMPASAQLADGHAYSAVAPSVHMLVQTCV